MTKDKIIEAANYVSPRYGKIGSFVDTDGEWCTRTTPSKFRAYLERLGFEVVRCYSTNYASAIAETADGYTIAYNGHCAPTKF